MNGDYFVIKKEDMGSLRKSVLNLLEKDYTFIEDKDTEGNTVFKAFRKKEDNFPKEYLCNRCKTKHKEGDDSYKSHSCYMNMEDYFKRKLKKESDSLLLGTSFQES